MPASHVANATSGHGQTASSDEVPFTVPASAVAGDVAVMSVMCSDPAITATTPAGWTLRYGPDTSGLTRSWLYTRTLTSGDPGSTVTVALSSKIRAVGHMAVYRGVTTTGLALARVQEGSLRSGTVTPTLTSVPAGAVTHVHYLRRRTGSPAADVTPPGVWTQAAASSRSATAHTTSVNLSAETVYRIPAASTVGGETASVTYQTVGTNYAVTLPASGSADVVVAGETATFDLSAPAGGPAGVPVTLAGATATFSLEMAETGMVTGSIVPVAPSREWPPAPYRQAIRSGLAISYSVFGRTAPYLGVQAPDIDDLHVVGGSIVDTAKPGVRRTLSLTLADRPGLFDQLANPAVHLHVTAHVRYTSRHVQDVPMGVFLVDAESLSTASGQLSLTGADKWVKVQRALFLRPESSVRGSLVVDEIVRLIRGAMAAEPVVSTATSTARVGRLTWERDRDGAILALARSIGAWVFFDRDGVATIADLPAPDKGADWLIDAGVAGVLVDLDRQWSRAEAANVVVVESSATDGERFSPQYVWDADPASPTYLTGGGEASAPPTPSSESTFGLVPFFYSSPILANQQQARAAGKTILARVRGFASQVSLEAVPNPAIDANAIIDVLPPGREVAGVETTGLGFGNGPFGTVPFGGGQTGTVRPIYRYTGRVERHVVDTVTHSLGVGEAQRIEGRSTRVEEVA